ncbi:MAG: hypothetical protein GXP05_14995, partial [Alphaproteobacteria bacterium]|nr:hypothetical protein [Alphaproteobacteria bacterium]
MSGGFGAGFVKGAFISLIGIGAVSLVMPLGQVDPAGKTQVDLSTPASSGFNAARSDTNPVLPVTDQKVVPVEQQKPQQKPKIAVLAQPVPAPDTSPATQPTAPTVAALPKVSPGAEKIAVITPPA